MTQKGTKPVIKSVMTGIFKKLLSPKLQMATSNELNLGSD